MSLTVFADLEQGSDEWLEARRGVLTASTIGRLITQAGVKKSASQTARTLAAQLIAERITGRIEPTPQTWDMLIGTLEEPRARMAYEQHRGVTVEQVGFILLETERLRLGYSPDGLVGDAGLIEIKSRRPKKQLATIMEGTVPPENMAQLQAGLFVTGREWIDYVSICGGMPLFITRVEPDERWFEAIERVARDFESEAAATIAAFRERTDGMPTPEYIDYDQEIVI